MELRVLPILTVVLKQQPQRQVWLIDQRNAGAAVTPSTSGNYLVDRFFLAFSQASKFTAQQNAGSVTPPAGFTKYLGFTVASPVSIGASDFFILGQAIEGLNIADLGWGTANAQTVTLSFKVYSSLTGTFGGSLRNNAANRFYPFSYTISSANTWTTVSVTIAGDTSGTWNTDNNVGINVYWGLGVGSSLSGTAGAWGASGYSATGATSVVGTNGATFYITGVDLRKGTVAPTTYSQDWRPYGLELALCQRYYEVGSVQWDGYATNGINFSTPVKFSVTKRSTPTNTVIFNSAVAFPATAGLVYDANLYGFVILHNANATTGAQFKDSWISSAEL